MTSSTSTTGAPLGAVPERVPWRRTIMAVAAVTAGFSVVGAVQLATGIYTPPLSDIAPLGLDSWLLPGVWLTATVAVPCALTAVLARRRSPRTGATAITAGLLLLVELVVQVPYVGLDPLQGVMGAVAVALTGLGVVAHRAARP